MKFDTRVIVDEEVIGLYPRELFIVDDIIYDPPPRVIHHSAMFTVELDHLCDPNDNDYCHWHVLEARRVAQEA